MKTIRFTQRRAEPGRIRLGVEQDNQVEVVRFILPRLRDDQVETLYWQNGSHADAVLLEDGVWPINARVTQHPGEFTCYIAIAAEGDLLWHSEAFYAAVYDLPEIEGEIDEAAPTAIGQATAAAGRAAAAAGDAALSAQSATFAAGQAISAARDARNAVTLARQSAAAEAARETAETHREDAEAARELAETARQAAESSRAAAESSRAAAETARAAQTADCTARVAAVETAHQALASAYATRMAAVETAHQTLASAYAARVAAVDEALDGKADVPLTADERPFGLFYANYGGPFIRSTVQQSAEAIARFAICVFSYAPNLESSCPATHLEIIRRAKRLNPALRVYSYITASSSHNGYTLNADGSWTGSPAQQAGVARLYSRHELIQYFRDLKHVGGVRTNELDAEGYQIMTGGFSFDGVFLDEFGADVSTDAKHYQGGQTGGGWRWNTPADKWNDIVNEAHRAGISTVNNAWESEQMLRECTALTREDCVLVETCEFAGDENVAGDSEVNWATYASAQRIYDYVKSEAYGTRGARVVSYNTLNRAFPAALAERAFTWAVFDTLAMGGHYVYVSHTESLDLPEAAALFRVADSSELTITRVDKGWFRLEANGHVLETIRKNADVYGPVTEENMALATVRIDGKPFWNACTTAPTLEYGMASRLDAAEARVDALSENRKTNAPSYVRLQIDDWQAAISPASYTNLFPTTFNTASGLSVATDAQNGLTDAVLSVENAWGWCRQAYTAELLTPFLGKTLELGWTSLPAFSDSLQFFVALDDERVQLRPSTSGSSRCGNTAGSCYVFSVPERTASLEIGWQAYGAATGASLSMTGLYLADTAEIDEAAAKTWYTNIMPTSGYTASACGEVTITPGTNALGRRVYEMSNTGMGDWGVFRADISGSAVEPYLGHTLELGCSAYEIVDANGSPYGGTNLKLILGADWSSGNALYPGAGAQCIRYTVPADATQFSVGWQGSGNIDGLIFRVYGLYLNDLDEEGVQIRGQDAANAWLRVCRVTEAALAADQQLLGNALYITDTGGLFVTDYSGSRTDIVVGRQAEA